MFFMQKRHLTLVHNVPESTELMAPMISDYDQTASLECADFLFGAARRCLTIAGQFELPQGQIFDEYVDGQEMFLRIESTSPRRRLITLQLYVYQNRLLHGVKLNNHSPVMNVAISRREYIADGERNPDGEQRFRSVSKPLDALESSATNGDVLVVASYLGQLCDLPKIEVPEDVRIETIKGFGFPVSPAFEDI